MEKKKLAILVTAASERKGTSFHMTYYGIFTDSKRVLNETERSCFEMVRDRPGCWKCGCVTGYPESDFTEKDWKYYKEYGKDHRFVIE